MDDAIRYVNELLRTWGPFSASQYARGYGVTRQAASKMLRKLLALGIIERDGESPKFRAGKATSPDEGRRHGGREFWALVLSGSPQSAYLDLGMMGKARLTKAVQANAFLRLVKHKERIILDFRRIERVSESFARALLRPKDKIFEAINMNPSITAIMASATWLAREEYQRWVEQEEAYDRYSPHGIDGL